MYLRPHWKNRLSLFFMETVEAFSLCADRLNLGVGVNYKVRVLQVRVETDPSDRTQMRITVASEESNTTYEYFMWLNSSFLFPHCVTALLDALCAKFSCEPLYLNDFKCRIWVNNVFFWRRCIWWILCTFLIVGDLLTVLQVEGAHQRASNGYPICTPTGTSPSSATCCNGSDRACCSSRSYLICSCSLSLGYRGMDLSDPHCFLEKDLLILQSLFHFAQLMQRLSRSAQCTTSRILYPYIMCSLIPFYWFVWGRI